MTLFVEMPAKAMPAADPALKAETTTVARSLMHAALAETEVAKLGGTVNPCLTCPA